MAYDYNLKTNRKIIWQPNPGSQALAMSAPANLILYHGTRGNGKTDVQLMRFRAGVGQGYGRHFRGLCTDVQLSSLDDIISKSKKYFYQFNDGARFLSSKGENRWVWPTGEELLFRAVDDVTSYEKLHGSEFAYIAINEASKSPDSTVLDLLMSLNRTSFVPEDHPLPDGSLLPELKLTIFLTTNPSGIGRNWLKKRFIDQSAPGEILKKHIAIFNPRTQEDEIITKTQCHIFGSWRENTKLSADYVADLAQITDPVKRKAWLLGDWDAGCEGGMFDDLWQSDVHIIKPFNIPHSGFIDRCFDWGSSAPFSIAWYWNSDGCDVTLSDGRTISTIRGDIFRIAEWYGAVEGQPTKGLMMLNAEITKGIVEREIAMGIYGRVKPGAADNSIWDVKSGASIAADMLKPVRLDDGKTYAGVTWRRSDKSPGSRTGGWQSVRKYLSGAVRPLGSVREFPGLFIFNTCKDFIEIFPTLSRDKDNMDDIDTRGCDHQADELRYKILSTATGSRSGKTKGV
jgi:hypothetical protein